MNKKVTKLQQEVKLKGVRGHNLMLSMSRSLEDHFVAQVSSKSLRFEPNCVVTGWKAFKFITCMLWELIINLPYFFLSVFKSQAKGICTFFSKSVNNIFVAGRCGIVNVICQTRMTVFNHISKHREQKYKYSAQRSILDQLRSVWNCCQILSWVLDMSSQLKLKRNIQIWSRS